MASTGFDEFWVLKFELVNTEPVIIALTTCQLSLIGAWKLFVTYEVPSPNVFGKLATCMKLGEPLSRA